MTILVDWQIEELIKQSGMVSPYNPALLNPASLDVRVGNEILVEDPDEHDGWIRLDISSYSDRLPCLISPKQFLLIPTLEVFNMPETVSGEFRIKSSRAREGYDNALAVWLDPGWGNSVLTLEIVNNCQFRRLPIYPGLRIGQIIFHSHAQPRKSYRETGRYNGDLTVMASKG